MQNAANHTQKVFGLGPLSLIAASGLDCCLALIAKWELCILGAGAGEKQSADGQHLRVLAPIMGGPAERAGVLPGDEVREGVHALLA